MRASVVVAAAVVVGLGCKKASEPPPPSTDDRPQLPATELKRGEDACRAYVAAVCACTTPAAVSACELARALPDALRVGIEVSTSVDATRRDVLHANDSVRKTIKECIEQASRLSTLGC